MPARLLLLAHAPTAAARAAVFAHRDDPCLPADTPRIAFRRRLAGVELGPERACAHTLAALGLDGSPGAEGPPDARDRRPGASRPAGSIDPDWAGPDPGQWAGLELAQVGAQAPEQLRAWLAGQDHPPPGGESLVSLQARVARAVQRPRGPGLHLVIASPWVVRAALLHTLGLGPGEHRRVEVGPLDAVELALGPPPSLRRLQPPAHWAQPGGRPGSGEDSGQQH